MHADYLLAAATMAEAERRAAERSRHGFAGRHRRRYRLRYRLAWLARRIAATARRLDPLPPLDAATAPATAGDDGPDTPGAGERVAAEAVEPADRAERNVPVRRCA